MNTKFLTTALIAAAGFAAAPGFAAGVNATGEVGYVPPAPVASNSGVTREAVRNEYLQARGSHTLTQTGEGADIGYTAVAATSTRSRDDVKNEYLQAKRNDQLNPQGEGADIGYVASQSLLSREAVRAEAVRAVNEGRIVSGE